MMSLGDAGAIAGCTTAGIAVLLLAANAGAHASRLKRVESAVEKLEITVSEHASTISAWAQFSELLKEVRDDLKDVITGKIRLPPPRKPDDGD